MFTAIFYLLAKKRKIPHHILKYNSFNEFEYLKTLRRVLVTWDLGMNYPLDRKLIDEIRSRGVQADQFRQDRIIT